MTNWLHLLKQSFCLLSFSALIPTLFMDLWIITSLRIKKKPTFYKNVQTGMDRLSVVMETEGAQWDSGATHPLWEGLAS